MNGFLVNAVLSANEKVSYLLFIAFSILVSLVCLEF